MNIRLTNDFLSGCLFALIGAGALIMARSYEFGTPARMGAGFFPTLIGAVLMILGGILIVRSYLQAGEAVGAIDFRPLLLIAAAAVFGYLIEDFGFPLAAIALVVLAHIAGRAFKPLQTIILALVLIVLCVALFAYMLGLNLPGTRIW